MSPARQSRRPARQFSTIVGGNRLASTAARVRLVPRLIDLVENAAILEILCCTFFQPPKIGSSMLTSFN